MSRYSTFMRLPCIAGLVGLLAAVSGASTASAQSVNEMVRTLNNVLNPGDAQRLEDQARRNGRLQEELVPGSSRLAAIPAIIVTEILGTIPADTTTVIVAAKLIQAIAATSVTLATSEITATTSAESCAIRQHN